MNFFFVTQCLRYNMKDVIIEYQATSDRRFSLYLLFRNLPNKVSSTIVQKGLLLFFFQIFTYYSILLLSHFPLHSSFFLVQGNIREQMYKFSLAQSLKNFFLSKLRYQIESLKIFQIFQSVVRYVEVNILLNIFKTYRDVN